MNEIVIDASVALRATFPDEPGHEEVVSALGDLMPSGFEPVAPDVFPYEVGNAIRRSALLAGPSAAARVKLFVDALQIVRLVRPPAATLASALAAPTRLSFYDAAYLATAEERGALLWTEDAAILKAAPDVATDTARLRARLRLGAAEPRGE